MRATIVLSASLTLVLLACTSEEGPTQPDVGGDLAPAALSLAAAPDTWTPRAPTLFDGYIYGYDLGMAPNSAGQSIVYTFGGASGDDEGVVERVTAYNVATDTWTWRHSGVAIFNSNGVGKIGNKLYISGGYNRNARVKSFERRLSAYDYTNDRMIRKADLPIFSAEGVTGVINGKLYVLPGACSGEGYPNPGYCVEEQTRRFYRYDPATNTWVTRRQAPHFHRQGAAVVIDGKFYVAGGIDENFQPIANLDVYDPATNTWRTLAPLPVGGPAAGGGLRGQFYVVVQGRAYAYNRITNQWKAKAAPEFFGSVTRVTLDGRSYLFTATADKSALYTP